MKDRVMRLARWRSAVIGIASLFLLANGLFPKATRSTTTPELDAKLAAYFEIYSNVLTIDERIAEATKANAGQKPSEIVIEKSQVENFVDHGSPVARKTKIPPLLLSAAANSDLIVMGIPLAFHSLPIKDRTFLFTEYTVRVDRVFFDNTHSTSSGDTIIISRAGGNLVVNGVRVEATEPAFEQFSRDQPYILALHAIAGTGTYGAIAPWTFVIADGLVSSASKLETKGERKKSLADFISDLEAAVAYRH